MALAGKVFPSLVADGDQVSRLRSPVGYWNALALLCAAGAVLGLWVATDRARRRGTRTGAVLVFGALVAVVLTTRGAGSRSPFCAALAWVALSGAAFESLAVLALAGARRLPSSCVPSSARGSLDDGEPYAVRLDDGMIFAPVMLAGGAAVGVARTLLLTRGRASERVRRSAVWATAARRLSRVRPHASVVRAGGPEPLGRGALARLLELQGRSLRPATRLNSLSSNHRWTWWQEAWRSFEDAPGEREGREQLQARELARALEADHGDAAAQPVPAGAQRHGIVGFLLLAGIAVARVPRRRPVRRPPGPERLATLALSISAAAESSRWSTSTGLRRHGAPLLRHRRARGAPGLGGTRGAA